MTEDTLGRVLNRYNRDGVMTGNIIKEGCKWVKHWGANGCNIENG
jgi:hypothetical protein